MIFFFFEKQNQKFSAQSFLEITETAFNIKFVVVELNSFYSAINEKKIVLEKYLTV